MALFKLKEFICKCGECKRIPDNLIGNVCALMEDLEIIRKHLGLPMEVTSGVRCKEHNEKVGGKDNSMHLKGRAADIQVKDMSGDRLAGFIEALRCCGKIPDGGLGTYETFVHYDTGAVRRWRG